MKLNRTYVYIVLSSLLLCIVLAIQVNWIFETASIKEGLFNEKAKMVLARTTDALSADTLTCRNLESGMGSAEMFKIDSLFNHYMKFYNFHIDYTFDVVKKSEQYPITNVYDPIRDLSPNPTACYEKSMDEISQNNGFELKLIFPEKEQFIRKEMSVLFITSVILILVVLIIFWKTVISLITEKKISEHTTDFLNNMTHEFKTPLTNIALAGRMILKDAHDVSDSKIKNYIGIILDENEKLRLQVEQVLSMTALERGEIPLQKTELDFEQIVKTVSKSFNIQIENKQGNLALNLHAEKPVVMGDKTHLANAISNLIDNAIKYSPGKPEIYIEIFNGPEYLIMIISDKGMGIEKKYHHRVFEKFFRVPTGNIHNSKGFGLGLAYVKTIMGLHGGTIEIMSENGKGTKFIITLPNA